MEKQLQDALVEVLPTVMEAKDFVLSELPDVVHQLLMWKVFESIGYNILAIVFVFVSIKMYKIAKENMTPKLDFVKDLKMSFCLIGGVILNILSICIVNIKFVQIWIAPKVYIIEYLKEMTK